MQTEVCRAPYGARGLKYGINHQNHHPYRRAPYGARGLKCLSLRRSLLLVLVAPRMGRVD